MTDRTTVLDIDFDVFVREPTILDWGHRESPMFQDLLWHPRAMSWASHPQLDLGEIITPPNAPHLEGFWDRLVKQGWQIDPTVGFAADSHAAIGKHLFEFFINQWPEHPIHIIHVDAHHDLGYSDDLLEQLEQDGRLSCDSWLYLVPLYLGEGLVEKITVVYPEWRREPCPVTDMRIDEGYEELLEQRAEQLDELGCELEITYWNDLAVPNDPINMITLAQSSAWVPPWLDSQFEGLIRSAPCQMMFEHFGPNQTAPFECRPNWPANWAGVKETYSHAMIWAELEQQNG